MNRDNIKKKERFNEPDINNSCGDRMREEQKDISLMPLSSSYR